MGINALVDVTHLAASVKSRVACNVTKHGRDDGKPPVRAQVRNVCKKIQLLMTVRLRVYLYHLICDGGKERQWQD